MRILVSGLVMSFAVALSACGGAGAGAAANENTANNSQAVPANSFYAIQNRSSYDIHYVYMSSTQDPNWGPDQLNPTQILAAGQTIHFNGVPCDSYDLKLVDEDGDECIQNGVQICQNTTLIITQDDLLRCEGY